MLMPVLLVIMDKMHTHTRFPQRTMTLCFVQLLIFPSYLSSSLSCLIRLSAPIFYHESFSRLTSSPLEGLLRDLSLISKINFFTVYNKYSVVKSSWEENSIFRWCWRGLYILSGTGWDPIHRPPWHFYVLLFYHTRSQIYKLANRMQNKKILPFSWCHLQDIPITYHML